MPTVRQAESRRATIWLRLLLATLVLTECVLTRALVEASEAVAEGTLERARHLYSTGQLDESRRLLESVLEAIDNGKLASSELGRCLDPLAEIYRVNGEYDKAIVAAERYRDFVLRMSDSAPGIISDAVCRSSTRLADLYVKTGRTDRAVFLLQQTAEHLQSRQGVDPLFAADMLVGRAELLDSSDNQRSRAEAWKEAEESARLLVRPTSDDTPPSNRYSQSVHLLARCRLGAGHTREARTLLWELAVRQQRHRQHQQARTTLLLIAATYDGDGNTGALIRVLTLALQAQRVIAPESVEEASLLIRLAAVEQSAGKASDSTGHLNKAVDICQTILTQSGSQASPGRRFAIQRQLMTAYRRLGDLPKAIAVGEELIRELERRNLSPDALVALRSELGAIYGRVGQYDSARPLLTHALEYWRESQPVNAVELSRCINNLAAVEQAIGSRDRAEVLFREALQVRQEHFPKQSTALAESHNNLGAALAANGKYAEAVQQYRLAIRFCSSGGGALDQIYLTTLLNLATAYKSQGQLDRAADCCKRALAAADGSSVYHAGTLVSLHSALAGLAILRGDWDLAERHARQGLSVSETQIAGPNAGTERLLHQLALVAYQRGDLRRAKGLWHKTLAIQRQSRKQADAAKTLVFLAHLAEMDGDDATAESHLHQAIDILRSDPRYPVVRYVALSQLAIIFRSRGEQEAARELLDEAVQLIETPRSELSGGDSQRAQYFAQFATGFDLLVDWCVEEDDLDAALAYVDRSRNRTFLDQLQLAGIDLIDTLPAGESDNLIRLEAELRSQISSLYADLDQPVIDSDENSDLQTPASVLDGLQHQYADVWNDIRGASSLYRKLIRTEGNVNAAGSVLSQELNDASVYVVYYVGATRSYLFTLRLNPYQVYVHELTATNRQASQLNCQAGSIGRSTISMLIHRYFQDMGDAHEFRSLGKKVDSAKGKKQPAVLTDVLFPESIREIIGASRFESVVIVPDGALHQLPFEALLVSEHGQDRYLLDALPPISYAPSLGILVTLTQRRAADTFRQRPILVVGNPVYVSSGNAEVSLASVNREAFSDLSYELVPLPFTATECNRVASVFGDDNVRLLLGKDATEKAVRAHVEGRRILHFAAHGLVDESHENLFGAIAVSTPMDDNSPASNDGFLSFHEIHSLNLTGTELAVLSACHTNAGPNQPLEAGSTMARSFLAAGARRVVCSHWSVNDESTAELIATFFEHIHSQETRGEIVDYALALKMAKEHVRTQERWKATKYWAPFVLIGPAR